MANRYLRTTGNDANGGTGWADAWQTWFKATTSLGAGDILTVAAGTYVTHDQHNVVPVNGVTIIGDRLNTSTDGAGRPIISNTSDANANTYILSIPGGTNTIEYLTFHWDTWGNSKSTMSLSGTTVVNKCSFIATNAGGGTTGGNLTLISIYGSCTFQNCIFGPFVGATLPRYGIVNNDSNLYFYNNIVYDISGTYLFIYDIRTAGKKFYFKNNNLMAGSGPFYRYDGLQDFPDNPTDKAVTDSNHNAWHAAGANASRMWGNVLPSVWQATPYFQDINSFICRNYTWVNYGFVSDVNYHLLSTSTLIDKGEVITTVTDDYDYVPRTIIINGITTYRNDIGPYHFPPPTDPSAATVTSIKTTTLTLGWTDNSTTEDGFHVYISTDNVTFTLKDTVGAGVVTSSITDLTWKTLYYFRIYSYNISGDSNGYADITATTTGEPASPSNLIITNKLISTLTLNWTDNSDNEDGFRIEYSKSNSITGFTTYGYAAEDATSKDLIGLEPAIYYWFRVYAYTGTIDSLSYANASCRMGLPLPPVAPSNGTYTNIKATSMTINWQDNSTDESGFRVEMSTNSTAGFTTKGSVGINVTSLSITGLLPSTTYYFRIYAFNIGGDSPRYETSQVTSVPPPAPAAPSKLVCIANPVSINNAKADILLSWQDNEPDHVDAEEGFIIERSEDGINFYEVDRVDYDVTNYTDTGLRLFRMYYYRIASYNYYNQSSYVE